MQERRLAFSGVGVFTDRSLIARTSYSLGQLRLEQARVGSGARSPDAGQLGSLHTDGNGYLVHWCRTAGQATRLSSTRLQTVILQTKLLSEQYERKDGVGSTSA